MADHERTNADWQRDAMDRKLDAALAKYVAAEPRAGLEERVLANLRAERERLEKHGWLRWPAISALAAALILVAVLLQWRSGRTAPDFTVQHSPTAKPLPAGTQVATKRPSAVASRQNARPVGKRALDTLPVPTTSTEPKLDQFPSPSPLNQQEKMLADYVAQHRTQAVLVARARLDALKKDLEEEAEAKAAGSNTLSDRTLNQQTNR